MKSIIWYKITIHTDQQNVSVYPNEGFDGIILETKEIDEDGSTRLYLDREEMDYLIIKMKEMMDHIGK